MFAMVYIIWKQISKLLKKDLASDTVTNLYSSSLIFQRMTAFQNGSGIRNMREVDLNTRGTHSRPKITWLCVKGEIVKWQTIVSVILLVTSEYSLPDICKFVCIEWNQIFFVQAGWFCFKDFFCITRDP